MCGIVGWAGAPLAGGLVAQLSLIAHRGPDDEGFWEDPRGTAGLGHRRLSILDLSPLGHQPMTSQSGRVHVVFNGEIYNFRELRAELESCGIPFRSNSDTEVLLALYEREGVQMLDRLNGVFAFAIWDEEKQELLCARDPMGVKPFYWTQAAGRFLFSSEIKALLSLPGVTARLDSTALACHLAYLWCPKPRTAFRDLWKLSPGHLLRVGPDGQIREDRAFWTAPYTESEGGTEAGRVAAFQSILQQSVTRQLVSDVPVGLFLSGGLDSSTLAWAQRKAMPGQPIDAFCSVTPEGDGRVSDWPYAQQIASALDIRLHAVAVEDLDLDRWARILWHLEEPQADPAIYHVDQIATEARRRGLKVLLSGAGGDDLLTGYRRHQALAFEGARGCLPSPVRRSLGWLGRRLPTRTNGLRRIRKFLDGFDASPDERIAALFEWLPARHVQELMTRPPQDDFRDALLGPLALLGKEVHPINRMLFTERLGFLPDHNLNYTDKLTMAHGVEARVPLLDLELVRFAHGLPVRDKLRGTTTKWILRQAMQHHLPHSVLHRPKTGFGAPLRSWLCGPMRSRMQDLLEHACQKRSDWFHPPVVRSLWADTLAGRQDGAYALWAIATTSLWADTFHVS